MQILKRYREKVSVRVRAKKKAECSYAALAMHSHSAFCTPNRTFLRTFSEGFGVYLAGGFQQKLRTVEGNALSGQLILPAQAVLNLQTIVLIIDRYPTTFDGR